jgi:hypothetical protein
VSEILLDLCSLLLSTQHKFSGSLHVQFFFQVPKETKTAEEAKLKVDQDKVCTYAKITTLHYSSPPDTYFILIVEV